VGAAGTAGTSDLGQQQEAGGVVVAGVGEDRAVGPHHRGVRDTGQASQVKGGVEGVQRGLGRPGRKQPADLPEALLGLHPRPDAVVQAEAGDDVVLGGDPDRRRAVAVLVVARLEITPLADAMAEHDLRTAQEEPGQPRCPAR
jgi:hypothetical protein